MIQWQPTEAHAAGTELAWFLTAQGRDPQDYAAAHEWSVQDTEGFWAAIWDYFEVEGSYERVLGSAEMPGADWFPGARINWAEHLLRGRDLDRTAIWHTTEDRALQRWTWGRLRDETAMIRAGLVAAGVGEGDRVAAYLPNIPETVAALLATASLGAVWSCAAPEFGAQAVIDRFAQIEPKVLLAVDGYRYGGKDHDRSPLVDEIHAAVGGTLVRFGHLDGTRWPDGFLVDAPLEFAAVTFSHPLWILFSSGTTGLPKAIVHSQGGMLLEQLKTAHLHVDARADDRVFWFTTTGWMMWNFLVGVLFTDAAIVLFDGSPAGAALWDLAAESDVTIFGGGAAYFAGQMKAGGTPRADHELPALRAIGSTGSPLSPETSDWLYEQFGPDLWLFSTSGGTDVCTAFVGGVPTLPVYRGELQARSLGCAIEAWDASGTPVVDAVGELVITKPMPSMPVFFWGDPDGGRYRDAYFDTYPGVWRHGDWITVTSRGTAVISGRSDATINRGGVRMGTSELYRAVLVLDDVVDALAVDLDDVLQLYVVLREGADLDESLTRAIARQIRSGCSPRHVPDELHKIAEVPRTLSGKALEIPVKKILSGTPPEQAVSRDSLANPSALDWFVARASASPAAP